MRMEHWHEDSNTGERFNCTNIECKMPFRCHIKPKPVKRIKANREDSLDRQARRHYDNGDHDYSMNG
jgi:hypothetical protein